MKQLMILTIFLFSSCGSHTTYRPLIHGHDYLNQEIIVPRTHERIHCGEKRFNKYVSLSLDDLTRLALVLKNAKLPKKVRLLVEKFSHELIEKNKSQEH